jgi:predicted NAD/FAD-binding protein
VLACHPNQALEMLDTPTRQEREVIGSFRYQPNRVVLHTDTSFMPKRRAAWASWAYVSEARKDNNTAVSLSYWMNHLQPLATKTTLIVTLNPHREPANIQNEHWFEHPVFDSAAVNAQQHIPALQGQNNTYYAGAWQRYGFHEDGLLSAVNVAAKMGISAPWK